MKPDEYGWERVVRRFCVASERCEGCNGCGEPHYRDPDRSSYDSRITSPTGTCNVIHCKYNELGKCANAMHPCNVNLEDLVLEDL